MTYEGSEPADAAGGVIPDITEQDIARVSAAIGVDRRRGAPAANKHIASPQRYEDKGEAKATRRKALARKFAASAFGTARWGRS
jgi:hypothetical protein